VIDGETCYNPNMTKLLEEAIERVRQLPEALQDEAAEILLSLVSKCAEPVHVDDETRTAVREGKAQASRGEFVTDEEMAEFFKRNRG
jgi:predicted transcriptional regulator